MSLSLSVDGPGDAELISAVRGGDVDAYGELFARHVDAARRLARQLAGPADADDLVSDAFTKVLTVLQRGGGPDLAFRAYLLTAVRRLHVDKIRAGSRLRPVDDLTPFDPGLPFQDTAVEGFDNAAAARAFASLPERWQMVLWHTEVEQQKPADIAVLLGMSANSVSALAYRAREGLRQAFLSQHASDPDDVDCAWTRDHLGAYVRGGLSRRDAQRVDDHLEDCRACAAVYLELTEVNSGLAGLLAPLLLGAAGAKYASSLGGGAAGGAGSTGFAGVQAWAAAHAGLTVFGGLAVTATALIAVYGATHLQGHDAADVGSPTLSSGPTAGAGQSPDGSGPGTSSRGANNNGKTAPGDSATAPVTSGTATASPSTDPSTDANTLPSTEPGASVPPGSTDASTGPGDPSTGPADPSTPPPDPGDDPITFTSVPPIDPTFGSTYRVQATTPSGKSVTFSVDGTPANACAIDSDLVTFDHAGTCVISAKLTARNATRAGGGAGAGIAARASSKVFSQTVVIPRARQRIDFHLGDGAQVDGTLPLQASGGASGKDVSFTSETPDVCSINAAGTKVAFHHAQGCTVTAAQPGNEDYRPADDVSHTVDVAQGDQTIDFTLPATAQVGDSLPLTASGGASGNDVTFTGNDACAVNEAGTSVTMNHATGCSVTAHQDGDADYNPGRATRTVDVAKGDQTVDFAPVTGAQVGTDSPLRATSSAGLDVTFTPADDNCTVQGSTVSFVHTPSCRITATAGNADWNDATATQTVDVAKGDQTIDFATVTGAKVGTDDTLQATSSAGLIVQFSSTDDSCTVQGSTVTFVHARACDVTATAASDDYNAASVSQRISIDKGDQQISFAPVTGAKVGTSDTLSATSSAGLPVSFTPGASANGACSVAGATVTYHHALACSVTATQAGNDDYNDATATQTVDVAKGDQTIDFAAVTGAKVGTGTRLVATSSAGLDVRFSSTDGACTVEGSTVTFLHASACDVTATAGDDDYNDATATQTVDVAKGDQTIDFATVTGAKVGTSDTLTATSSAGLPVTFSPAADVPDASCTVEGSTVTFVHSSACEVTASAGNDDYNDATATQTIAIDKGDQTIDFAAIKGGKVGTDAPLEATSSVGLDVRFSSTDGACTVEGSTVTFVHASACVLTATAGNDDYNDATATQTIAIDKGDQTIDFAPVPGGKVGTSAPLRATSSAGLDVTFAAADANCTVKGASVSLAHTPSCRITASAGNDDWTTATADQTITIDKADQQITFTLPGTAKVGDKLSLTAAGGSSGNPVTYTLAADSSKVCTISGSTLGLDHVGTCRVVAHQKGNADYNDAPEATQTVTVAKADQHIAFTLPGTAKVGDKLSLTATGGSSGNPVTYTISGDNQKNCSITGSTLSLDHVGTCRVAAHQKGNADYNDAPEATQTVTVAKADQQITFTLPGTAKAGDKLPLTATGGASGNPVTYTLAGDSSKVCTITNSTLGLDHVGTCRVVAHQKGNADYNDAPDVTRTVTVSPAPVDLSVDVRAGLFPNTVLVTVHGLPSGDTTTLTVSSDPRASGLTLGNGCIRLGDLGSCTVTGDPQTYLFAVAPPDSGPTTLTFTVEPLEDAPDPDLSNNTRSFVIRP